MADHRKAPASAPFKWDDPFLLEDQLAEDERLVRDTARDYAQEKLGSARRRGLSQRAHRPRHLSTRWARWACSASTVDEAYGGAGASAMSPMVSSPARSSASIPAIAR